MWWRLSLDPARWFAYPAPMRTLGVVGLVVALSAAPAAAAEPRAGGTRGVVVTAEPDQVRLVEVNGREVPTPFTLDATALGDGLVLVQRPTDLPIVLDVAGRRVPVAAADGPAVARLSGVDRRATALATARTSSRQVAVAAPADRLDLALLAATGPWPVLWSPQDAALIAPEVVDLADFPVDVADFAVSWDQRVRQGPRDRVFLVTDTGVADLAAAAAFGETTLVTSPDALPGVTRDALVALAPNEVIVVGGTRAVGNGVVRELQALGLDVRRVSGADRTATSAALLSLWPVEGPVALVRGDAPVDAVAAASLDVPVLLTAGPTSIGKGLIDVLASPNCRLRGVLVAGGRAAVPELAELPSCRMRATELLDAQVAELQQTWAAVAAEAGRPISGPADPALVEEAVRQLAVPVDLEVRTSEGQVTWIQLRVQRTRPDGEEFADATWPDGDLSRSPELVAGSSTVEVRED